LKKRFNIPSIVGHLYTNSDGKDPINIHLSSTKKNIKHIALKTDARYLKNIADSIKLVGLSGLTICRALQKKVSKHLPLLDPIAKKSGTVELVVQKNGWIMGYDIRGNTLLDWADKYSTRTTKKRATLIGRHQFMDSFKGSLTYGDWIVGKDPSPSLIIIGTLTKKQLEGLDVSLSSRPRLILDLGGYLSKKRWKGVKILNCRQFTRLCRQTTATLLTLRR
jgi:hypothetical protein